MRTIHKQEIEIKEIQHITVPYMSELLYVARQKGKLCVWYLCTPGAVEVKECIYCYGTGHEIEYPDSKRYLSTVILMEGDLVLHFFAEKQK